MKAVNLNTYMSGLTALKDGGWSIRLVTDELTGEEVAAIHTLFNQRLNTYLKPEEAKEVVEVTKSKKSKRDISVYG